MPLSRDWKFTHPLGTLLLLALSAIPAKPQNLDALYDKAKSEGALILYAGGPTAPWDAAAKDFSARYPGVSVSVTGGFSSVLDKKIDAQLASMVGDASQRATTLVGLGLGAACVFLRPSQSS